MGLSPPRGEGGEGFVQQVQTTTEQQWWPRFALTVLCPLLLSLQAVLRLQTLLPEHPPSFLGRPSHSPAEQQGKANEMWFKFGYKIVTQNEMAIFISGQNIDFPLPELKLYSYCKDLLERSEEHFPTSISKLIRCHRKPEALGGNGKSSENCLKLQNCKEMKEWDIPNDLLLSFIIDHMWLLWKSSCISQALRPSRRCRMYTLCNQVIRNSWSNF